MCKNTMMHRFGVHKSPVVYGKTFDFVERICVKADGYLGLLLTPHFVLHVLCKAVPLNLCFTTWIV